VLGIRLGLGLIGIGKPWGYANPLVPPEKDALALLERAVELGVRFFDTAPSYGVSEERLGKFLRGVTLRDRAALTIATKFGEHWDTLRQEPYVDHSFEALRRSLDETVARIGIPDILELHKTTPTVLRSDALARAWEYAQSLGIRETGASVSDPESAEIVLASPRNSVMQLPYNRQNRVFEGAIDAAIARGAMVLVNRPFGMGKMLYDGVSKSEAFRFVLQKGFQGVVLSGTKSAAHLEENWAAFREAQSALTSPAPAEGRHS
jgi:aryl-alcohol dehydrogenase-like predicted oxidoreductase